MDENKDLEIIKTNVIFMQQCENTCEAGMQEAFENIICAAERMAAEIERLKKHEETSNYLLGSAKDHIDRLKAELEDKAQQISDMRGCLHDYEERMNELERRPEVNCDQTNCKHNTEKKCVSSKLYFECLYSDNGRMDCDYFQRRESEEK